MSGETSTADEAPVDETAGASATTAADTAEVASTPDLFTAGDAKGPAEDNEPEDEADALSHKDIAPAMHAEEGSERHDFASVTLAAVAANHLVGGHKAESESAPAEQQAVADDEQWVEPAMEPLTESDDEQEDDNTPTGPKPIAIPWKSRNEQVCVLTNAGKLVYVRYGDENEMLGYMGVIQAIISRCECDTEERIRHIVAGDRIFVFALKEPLYLLIISKRNVPIPFLRRKLDYVYRQITFVLTAKVYDHLTTHPNYDVRSMLGPQDQKLLECLMRGFASLPQTLFNAFSYLPLHEDTRHNITHTIQRAHVSGGPSMDDFKFCR